VNASTTTFRGVEINALPVPHTGAVLYQVVGSPWRFSSLESARKYIRTNSGAAARFAAVRG